jgi:hypothetical protein
MLITAVYLYGAWTGKWAFGPWWLAACVVLDVYWITGLYGLVNGGEVEPIFSIKIGEQ